MKLPILVVLLFCSMLPACATGIMSDAEVRPEQSPVPAAPEAAQSPAEETHEILAPGNPAPVPLPPSVESQIEPCVKGDWKACSFMKNDCDNKGAQGCIGMGIAWLKVKNESEGLRYYHLACDYGGGESICNAANGVTAGSETPEVKCANAKRVNATHAINDACYKQHNGEACYRLAAEAVLCHEDNKTHLWMGCEFGYDYACADYGDEALRAVTCGMTSISLMAPSKIKGELASIECRDGVDEVFRYGNKWVFFRSGGAFLVQDHADYKGPCIRSQLLFGSVRGHWICEKSQ